jgi:hypothetical protein
MTCAAGWHPDEPEQVDEDDMDDMEGSGEV